MRISVDINDPGYSKDAYMWKAYLSGKELKYCITADEELGVAECFAQGEDGEPFIDPQNPGEHKKVIVTGAIVIKRSGELK